MTKHFFLLLAFAAIATAQQPIPDPAKPIAPDPDQIQRQIKALQLQQQIELLKAQQKALEEPKAQTPEDAELKRLEAERQRLLKQQQIDNLRKQNDAIKEQAIQDCIKAHLDKKPAVPVTDKLKQQLTAKIRKTGIDPQTLQKDAQDKEREKARKACEAQKQ